MFGGLFSLIGLSWGNGGMAVGGAPEGAPSFPPAGTILNTQTDQVYPTAEGGAYFSFNGNFYPNQQADVYEKADGSGGFYLDWANVFNVEWIPYGTYALTDTSAQNSYGSVEVPTESSSYYSPQYTYSQYNHDGSGGYVYYAETSPTNYPAGTQIVFAYDENFVVSELYFVNSEDYYVNNGKYYDYQWVGDGTNYQVSGALGSYYAGGNSFYSTSSYTNVNGTDYNNGTGTEYQHNGSGGYTTVGVGNYYPNGYLIYAQYINGSQNSVEVPSGSGMYFDSEDYGSAYVWDGSGGYSGVSFWNKPYGTYITNYDGYDWYWDGLGAFYGM